jgi:hypothetical protein
MIRAGEFIRFKRTSLDITIENAASLCGVSKQNLNNIKLALFLEKLIFASHSISFIGHQAKLNQLRLNLQLDVKKMANDHF